MATKEEWHKAMKDYREKHPDAMKIAMSMAMGATTAPTDKYVKVAGNLSKLYRTNKWGSKNKFISDLIKARKHAQ